MLQMGKVVLGPILWLLLIAPAQAAEVVVAVAANFVTTAATLVENFERPGDDTVVLVQGSTGKLYAQIVNGAPYDLFLAADSARPELLENAGLTVGRFAYAFGRLVFVRRDLAEADIQALADETPRLAMADPVIAPYGAAAKQLLVALRGQDNWNDRVVYGESVGQAFGFVATGNATTGLVALSQVDALPFEAAVTEVPQDLYAPIRQEAVLLKRAADNPTAAAFFAYLASAEAAEILIAAGYGVAE